MSIGALVTNSHLAAHPSYAPRYPVLAEAILHGASGQIRNMATTGGNLMQRTLLLLLRYACALQQTRPRHRL